jgi:hypothetical protein
LLLLFTGVRKVSAIATRLTTNVNYSDKTQVCMDRIRNVSTAIDTGFIPSAGFKSMVLKIRHRHLSFLEFHNGTEN